MGLYCKGEINALREAGGPESSRSDPTLDLRSANFTSSHVLSAERQH